MMAWLLRAAVYIVIIAGLGLMFVGFAGVLGGFRTAQPPVAPDLAVPADPVSAPSSSAATAEEAPANHSAGQFAESRLGNRNLPLPALAPGEGFLPYRVEAENPLLAPAEALGSLAQAGQDEPAVEPLPEATALPPANPERIIIQRIGLDAPIVLAPAQLIEVDGTIYRQWEAPAEFAAGWHEGSARLGEPGNTVINGHHNIHGKVFERLVDVQVGDGITILSGGVPYHYVVTQAMVFHERNQPIETREANAQWLLPSADERLTLVTCWPPESNTHRLMIVAVPVP